ncbi:MAG: hypothetical protein KJ856_12940 [Gammaproteobacteria bacterium]|nr:hypothetical protein [Gammaproteobacteria bacterium]MBU1479674.1 hypothetical protein [Gammaproteobacteria bacterium]MBU1999738.1 hypothetical protein [Gammaproteobacteria bacterium]MBU2131732.1 hypothetical protein [Gammaproteobacteria bacterium]MBU2187898.1 hypothetical protein [Gammaproteobacteria bacterium]
MKLYVFDHKTKSKKYINVAASSRRKLEEKLKSATIIVDGNKYSVSEIKAETNPSTTIAGGILGGALGALGGGAGVLIGGLIGTVIASAQAQKEKKEADEFNGSEA